MYLHGTIKGNKMTQTKKNIETPAGIIYYLDNLGIIYTIK